MRLHWLRLFRNLRQNLSVRAGLYCVGAIISALLAVKLSPFVPDGMADLLGGGAVDHILTIFASSMLAVVTFSLSTLIASYSIAGNSAPSRAISLIMRDERAQNALSTFLGAFIFSVVALVALSTNYYGAKGRVILFFMTVVVIGAVIWRVIRWIGQLSGLGQLPNVLSAIEAATAKSIRSQSFYFQKGGAKESNHSISSFSLKCDDVGFIQVIDLETLSEIAEECRIEIWLKVHSGGFVSMGTELARYEWIEGSSRGREVEGKLRGCFIIGTRRTFEEDPRFGLIVLSEIASRALSPGVNDAGTAIEVIGSLTRVISQMHEASYQKPEVEVSNLVHVWPIAAAEIIDDAFQAIARDGAGIVEVGIFLQKALAGISLFPEFTHPAQIRARRNLTLSQSVPMDEFDFNRLRRAAHWAELGNSKGELSET